MDPQHIGKIRVTNFIDSVEHWSPRLLFTDITYDDLKANGDWLRPHFLDEDCKLLLSIHAFVVQTDRHTILVDTCLGEDKKRGFAQWNMRKSPFLDVMTAGGFPPESIDYVFCTHMHVDHVGWNTRLDNGRWVPTFPNAKYLFHKTEWDFWKSSDHEEGELEVITDSVLPVIEAGQVQWVDNDFAIDDCLHLEPTPGHTPGHCAVHLSSAGEEGVITGDMIHHPVQIGEPLRGCSADADPAQANATRKQFVERYADTNVRILGTHFHHPTALRIVDQGGRTRPTM
jgi:glyoxylase-like metal-dependent hydrolase (beta-lactamase superfamily II)